MAAANFAPEIMTKIKEVTSMNYQDQAIFYLNAFWQEGGDAEAETVWELVQAFVKEDHIKGKNGNELNPIQAFHVLQGRNQTLTALELKAQLRKVDIDANGEMALCEYLLFINNRDPIKFITNPQGEIDPVQLKALEDKLAEVNAKFDALQVQLEAEKVAEAAAKAAEADAIAQETAAKAAEQIARDEEAKAKAAEQVALDEEAKAKAAEQVARDEESKAKAAEQVALDEEAKAVVADNAAKTEAANAKAAEQVAVEAAAKAKLAEAEVRKLEDEARAIDAEIKKEEEAKASNITRLEALSVDQTVGIVKRNMAVQELAQAKGEDSLPLRKAKLTQEAVVRRLAKATKAAAEETVASEEAAKQSTVAKKAAEDAAAKAVQAREAAEAKRALAVAAREAAEQKRALAVAARELAEKKRAEAVQARELAEQKRADAVAAREAAEAKRALAVQAREAAEAQAAATAVAIKETQALLKEVEFELEELNKKSGAPLGMLWFTDRLIQDKKRSMPTRCW